MTRLYETIRILLITTLAGATLGNLEAQDPPVVHPPQPPRRIVPNTGHPAELMTLGFRIPKGMPISVRLVETVSSKVNTTGTIFKAVLDQDIEVQDAVVLARGTRLYGEVLDLLKGGRVKGRAELTVTLREVEVDGVNYRLETSSITVVARANKSKDTKKVGIAAGLGALIGAIVGGKKGAAVGATIGGSAQTARVLTSRGEAAEIEKERLLSFRLEKDFEYVPG